MKLCGGPSSNQGVRYMRRSFRRALATGAASLGLLAGSVFGAPTAEAQELALDFDVSATVHIKKLDIENTVEGGSFTGQIDLATGELTADLTLPPSEIQTELLGLNAATVGFETVPVGQTTGTVDLNDLSFTASSEFNIKLSYVRPLGLPLNLVGDNCQTGESITIDSSGVFNPDEPAEISAEFEIPQFQSCGLITPIINLLIPGPGNTFTATLTPAE